MKSGEDLASFTTQGVTLKVAPNRLDAVLQESIKPGLHIRQKASADVQSPKETVVKLGTMKLLSVIALVLCITTGSVTAASAAPAASSAVAGVVSTQASPAPLHVLAASGVAATATNASVPTRLSVVPRGYRFNKMMAFLGCITGVGVPIAAGILLLTTPAGIRFIAGMGPLPAGVGAIASKYAWYIKGTCGYALFH